MFVFTLLFLFIYNVCFTWLNSWSDWIAKRRLLFSLVPEHPNDFPARIIPCLVSTIYPRILREKVCNYFLAH